MVELSRPCSRCQNGLVSKTHMEHTSPDFESRGIHDASSTHEANVRRPGRNSYLKKAPLTFLLKKDWSAFITCLQGRYRQYQHSRRRSRRLLHAYKSLYYEYCYVCDNLLPTYRENEKVKDLLSYQNSNTEAPETVHKSIDSLSDNDLKELKVNSAGRLSHGGSFRRKFAPLMRQAIQLLPDSRKPYDSIRRSYDNCLQVYCRKRVRQLRSHHVYLKRHSDRQLNSMLQLPIALDLLMPKIQVKICKVMDHCQFLTDPLEVAAELRHFNYNVSVCVKHFEGTKCIRDIIDEILPPTSDCGDMAKNWLKVPLSGCRIPESLTDDLQCRKVSSEEKNKVEVSRISPAGENQDEGINVSSSKKTSRLNSSRKPSPFYSGTEETGIDNTNPKSQSFHSDAFQEEHTDDSVFNVRKCASSNIGEIMTAFNNENIYNTMRCLVNIKLTHENIKCETVAMIESFKLEMANFANNLKVAFEHLLMETISNEQIKQIHRLENCVEELQSKCREEERKRKYVYNLMQEQLGNVRVCCRCRDIHNSKVYVEVGSDRVNLLMSPKEEFLFDKVFSSSHSQKEIYEDFQPLVTSFIDGYNVCFITYGGEASGKTYTLLGNDTPGEEGIIQRSLDTVLHEKSLREFDWELSLSASLIEIYNDVYNDFLEGKQNVHLYIDQGLDEVFKTLKHVPINSEADIKAIVKICRRRRKVASTALNAASSRSHLIALIRLDGRSKIHGDHLRSFLALCDLAGFEDIVKAETQSDAKLSLEASFINRSLTAFNRVFVALRKQDPRTVPYRDSKLTYFLKPFLTNSGKCCLLVTVRTDKKCLSCTQNTLRFGRETRCVTLGKAKRQINFDKLT